MRSMMLYRLAVLDPQALADDKQAVARDHDG
jgi:hypothetical protein